MAFLTINASAIHRPTVKTDGEQQAAYAANECCEPILMWCAPGSSTPLMRYMKQSTASDECLSVDESDAAVFDRSQPLQPPATTIPRMLQYTAKAK